MKSITATRENGSLWGEGEASLDLETEEKRLHNDMAARKKSRWLRREREEPQRWPPTPRRDDEEGGTSTEPSPPSLRQIKRKASHPGAENGDVENGHRRRGNPRKKSGSKPRGRRASSSSDVSSSSFASVFRYLRDLCGGPAVTSRDILRKVGSAILTDLDDETLRREDTEPILIGITLVKEAILGVLIAFSIVSLCLFLDHNFSMKLPTARHLRRATSHLMVNQETLADLEESSGLKIMTEDQRNEYLREIKKAKNKTLQVESVFKEWSKDLEAARADVLRAERLLHKLKTDMGLDLYCEACMYSQQVSCADRAARLENRYRIPAIKARLAVMQRASCRRYPPGRRGERRRRETRGLFRRSQLDEVGEDPRAAAERVAETWYMHVDNFCPKCAFSDGVTCMQQATALRQAKRGTSTDEAMARVIVESRWCRNDYYERKIEERGGFCRECQWGHSSQRSCEARAEYLMQEFGLPEYIAQLSAMDRPPCAGKG